MDRDRKPIADVPGESAVAEQHRLLTLLMQNSDEGFWFIDTDAITTDVNPAMCRILQRSHAEVVGKSVLEFVDLANATTFRREFDLRGRGLPSRYELNLTRPDGSQICCLVNATPILDESGRLLGSIGMYSDISERKLAERQLRDTRDALLEKTEALQVTLDSISQGIVSRDAQGNAKVYNLRMLEMLDLPESLFTPGHSYEDAVRFQAARGDFGDGGLQYIDPQTRKYVSLLDQYRVSDHYVRKTRSGGHMEVRTRRLPGGGMVRTFADVSAYFAAHEQLVAAKEEAESANRAKSHFLSSMSHELRTPMNAILGFGQLLGSDAENALSECQRGHVDEIMRAAQHLRQLIDEMLEPPIADVVAAPELPGLLMQLPPSAAESGRGAPAGDAVPSAATSTLRKVLYIEDNPVNILLMRAMLARVANLEMISAPLPSSGLQMAQEEQPDLILLDIQLPGMDGYEVLRRLRLDATTTHIPVIAVSANAMPEDVRQGLAAGFVRYLTKPVDLLELIATVERTLAAP
ncbi:hypothetical protein BH11PSE8_BH11PSE8_18370 [soil metagenome]